MLLVIAEIVDPEGGAAIPAAVKVNPPRTVLRSASSWRVHLAANAAAKDAKAIVVRMSEILPRLNEQAVGVQYKHMTQFRQENGMENVLDIQTIRMIEENIG